LGGFRRSLLSSIVLIVRSIDPVLFVYIVIAADDPSTRAAMDSCKAVGPGVSGGEEEGGGVFDEGDSDVDMVLMGMLLVDLTNAAKG
jgi:hypothetical protein